MMSPKFLLLVLGCGYGISGCSGSDYVDSLGSRSEGGNALAGGVAGGGVGVSSGLDAERAGQGGAGAVTTRAGTGGRGGALGTGGAATGGGANGNEPAGPSNVGGAQGRAGDASPRANSGGAAGRGSPLQTGGAAVGNAGAGGQAAVAGAAGSPGASGGSSGKAGGASVAAGGGGGAGGSSTRTPGGAGGAAGRAAGVGGSAGNTSNPAAGAGGAAGSGTTSGRCDGIARATAVEPSTTHLDVGAHDPAMIWDGSRYYLFVTGGTLGVRSSSDMKKWTDVGNIFKAVPTWISTAIGSKPPDLWAPDISYFNDEYHVYYAGSTFGSRSSVIGLVTSPTLQSTTWTDRGLIVQSKTSDDFNAIDPNVAFDEDCTPWLSYGSFWTGIKIVKLDGSTGKPKANESTVYSIASRNGGAIEAPSIVSHNGYYYLFVSFDKCCDGVNSTYRTMVGRAQKINGPYTNKAGTDMMKGAGEQLLASSGRYIGPGGGTAWTNGDAYWYAYHYYDGQANGASKLAVRPIRFGADDWVTLGDAVFP